jgi:hypothetical protein
MLAYRDMRFNNDLAYAPVPPEITARSEAFIRQISVDGQPGIPGPLI